MPRSCLGGWVALSLLMVSSCRSGSVWIDLDARECGPETTVQSARFLVLRGRGADLCLVSEATAKAPSEIVVQTETEEGDSVTVALVAYRKPECGDGLCDRRGEWGKAESCRRCPADCPECVCGDGQCDEVNGERPDTCPEDCPIQCFSFRCGDGRCDSGEDSKGCALDCAPTCNNGKCDSGETGTRCPNDCLATCGDAKCDRFVGEDGWTCRRDCLPACGDGTCAEPAGEDSWTCPKDCLPTCGDGTCEAAKGEDGWTCRRDCLSTCGDGTCEAAKGETTDTCPEDCPTPCGAGSCCREEKKTCKTCPQECGACSRCGDGVCADGRRGPDRGENCLTCITDCGACGPPCLLCYGWTTLDATVGNQVLLGIRRGADCHPSPDEVVQLRDITDAPPCPY